MDNEKKDFGHFEEAPKVAVVENYGVMFTLSEEEVQRGEDYVRQRAAEKLAEMLCKENRLEISTAPSEHTDPATGKTHTIVTASLYIKTKDSDILRTGKTKFVKG